MPKVTLKRAISFGHGVNQKVFQAGNHIFGLEEMTHWAIPGLKASGDLIVHPDEDVTKNKPNPVRKVIFVSNGEQVQVPFEEAKNIISDVPAAESEEKKPEPETSTEEVEDQTLPVDDVDQAPAPKEKAKEETKKPVDGSKRKKRA